MRRLQAKGRPHEGGGGYECYDPGGPAWNSCWTANSTCYVQSWCSSGASLEFPEQNSVTLTKPLIREVAAQNPTVGALLFMVRKINRHLAGDGELAYNGYTYAYDPDKKLGKAFSPLPVEAESDTRVSFHVEAGRITTTSDTSSVFNKVVVQLGIDGSAHIVFSQ